MAFFGGKKRITYPGLDLNFIAIEEAFIEAQTELKSLDAQAGESVKAGTKPTLEESQELFRQRKIIFAKLGKKLKDKGKLIESLF